MAGVGFLKHLIAKCAYNDPYWVYLFRICGRVCHILQLRKPKPRAMIRAGSGALVSGPPA